MRLWTARVRQLTFGPKLEHCGREDSLISDSTNIEAERKFDTYASFMEVPHFAIVGVHLSRIALACGTIFGAFNPGNFVSYGGLSLIFQKNRHFGSGLCAVISSGLSAGSKRAITSRQGSSTAHFGFSVFSRVTPIWYESSGRSSRLRSAWGWAK